MKFGIITAVISEARFIKQSLQHINQKIIDGITYITGSINDHEIVLVIMPGRLL